MWITFQVASYFPVKNRIALFVHLHFLLKECFLQLPMEYTKAENPTCPCLYYTIIGLGLIYLAEWVKQIYAEWRREATMDICTALCVRACPPSGTPAPPHPTTFSIPKPSWPRSPVFCVLGVIQQVFWSWCGSSLSHSGLKPGGGEFSFRSSKGKPSKGV